MQSPVIISEVRSAGQKGVSVPELIVVLLVAAIIIVLALPQVLSSRRLFRFSGIQREVTTSLREARQEAMSQRKTVTFRYDNGNKKIFIYGGDFGTLGDPKNRYIDLAGAGVDADDVKYGRPPGVPASALGDTTNLTNLSSNAVEITFQPDGSVINASNNPQNQALFFYHEKYRLQTAFAVSVLGAGGRIKVWRYSQGVNAYVE
ncbi:MAG: GspH/FimT family pseudopilin [Acidobacteria bacterium]|nr:GspH/FimT family pseudopilin [Acidobacteriota bacterium]